MAILKAVNPKEYKAAEISNIIDYVCQNKKNFKELTYGHNVSVHNCAEQMEATKKFWNKLYGRPYYHFVQSFHPEEKISPEEALEMAKLLLAEMKELENYEVFLVTHLDREHIHTHFIINSVSFVNGKKFQYNDGDLARWKRIQDDINYEHGFMRAPKKGFDQFGNKRTSIVANDRSTYELLKSDERVDNYIDKIERAILKNAKVAKSKAEFIELMKDDNITTSWRTKKKQMKIT